MFLGILNVCVERSAKLLFHAGRERGVITPAATWRMTAMYNAALRNYVESNHFMDTLTLHAIPGSMIIDRLSGMSAALSPLVYPQEARTILPVRGSVSIVTRSRR